MKNKISGIEYQNNNQELLQQVKAIKNYTSDEWITFVQCQDINLKIKKGEKGTRLVRVFATNEGELGKEKKAVRFFTVFNIDQTETITK